MKASVMQMTSLWGAKFLSLKWFLLVVVVFCLCFIHIGPSHVDCTESSSNQLFVVLL